MYYLFIVYFFKCSEMRNVYNYIVRNYDIHYTRKTKLKILFIRNTNYITYYFGLN